jgi:hypothetical protein
MSFPKIGGMAVRSHNNLSEVIDARTDLSMRYRID